MKKSRLLIALAGLTLVEMCIRDRPIPDRILAEPFMCARPLSAKRRIRIVSGMH